MAAFAWGALILAAKRRTIRGLVHSNSLAQGFDFEYV